MALRLRCHGLDAHGRLAAAHTGRGVGASPALSWEDVPPEAMTLALVLENMDAPLAPAVHWLMFNIPARADELMEGVPPDMILEGGAKHGLNAARRPGYLPPNPAAGATGRFRFTLYALDKVLSAGPGASLRQLSQHFSSALDKAGLGFTVRGS